MKVFSAFLFKVFGWKSIITIQEPAKSVICIAPHTSNWDFLIGELFYKSLGRHSHFLMKKSWFFFPMGVFLRAIGGVPVDRSKRSSITDQMAEEFAKREAFHLAVTPEGTRKLVKKWKMGFYHIAIKAQVPIQLAYIDYAKKEMGITRIFYPTGDEATDLAKIQAFYNDVTPCHPENFYRESN